MSDIQLTRRTREEIAVCDNILSYLFKKFDRYYEIGDLFIDKYARSSEGEWGIVTLIGAKFSNENAENLYHEQNIILLFQCEGYKKQYSYPDLPKGVRPVSLNDLRQYRDPSIFKIVAKSREEYESDVKGLVDGKYTMDELLAKAFPAADTSKETGIMIMNKDVLEAKKRDLIIQSQFAMARVEAAKNYLEARRRQMEEMAAKMNKFVAKLNRLIWSIELYMGIKEELQQFSFGANAPADEPICFRQRRMYMDEEVGDPGDGLKGLDFTKIDVFDEWLVKDNTYWKTQNYKLLVPEEKCIVICRVRRKDKDYIDNPWINKEMNKENMLTYILVRNGENLFRIYGDIVIGEKLFPDQSELEELILRANGEWRPDTDEFRWIHGRERNMEEADNTIERYKLNMILLQGIIERTPCFPDNCSTTSLFSPEGYEGKIKFIYDATLNRMLPSHIPPFSEWRNKLSEKIAEGSRIFWTTQVYNSRGDGHRNRFFKVYYNEYSVPRGPSTGLYQVYSETITKRETQIEQLYIKFNPGGERNWSWSDDYDTDRTRKNRLSYAIFRSDQCVFNWDAMGRDDLELLEFYMHTRIGRENYLSYIPVLMNLYAEKKKEIAKEDDFIRLCLTQAGLDPEDYFGLGIRAMEWWKLKNKWKRALTVDDSKALRMIVKKLKS